MRCNEVQWWKQEGEDNNIKFSLHSVFTLWYNIPVMKMEMIYTVAGGDDNTGKSIGGGAVHSVQCR